ARRRRLSREGRDGGGRPGPLPRGGLRVPRTALASAIPDRLTLESERLAAEALRAQSSEEKGETLPRSLRRGSFSRCGLCGPFLPNTRTSAPNHSRHCSAPSAP